MSITPDDIHKVARLAYLQLPENNDKLQHHLDKIITWVDHINHVDTTDINPLAHPLEIEQPTRADIITESNQREQLMQNAPETLNHLFVVPQFIETE